MKPLRSHLTRRLVFFCALVLAIILAVSAVATSIATGLTENFTNLQGFDGGVSPSDYGSKTYTDLGGVFKFQRSAYDPVVQQGAGCNGGGSNACLNMQGDGSTQETLTISTTNGDTFNFVSYWDYNYCSTASVQEIDGYVGGTGGLRRRRPDLS